MEKKDPNRLEKDKSYRSYFDTMLSRESVPKEEKHEKPETKKRPSVRSIILPDSDSEFDLENCTREICQFVVQLTH